MSGGLADDMHFVAVWGNADVAGPAVGLGNGVGIGGGFDEASEVGGTVGGEFGQPQTAWRVSVPEFDGADDQHLAVVAAALPTGRGIVPGPEGKGWPRRSRPDPTAGCARGRPWPYAACVRAARRFGTSRYRAASGVAARRFRWNGSPSGRRPRTRR